MLHGAIYGVDSGKQNFDGAEPLNTIALNDFE
jgi:hypothetical protein